MKKKGTTSAKAKRQNRKQRQHKVIKILLAGMLLISTGHEIYKAETEKINTEYKKEMNAANPASASFERVTWEAGTVVNLGGEQGKHVAVTSSGRILRQSPLDGGTEKTYKEASDEASNGYLNENQIRAGLSSSLIFEPDGGYKVTQHADKYESQDVAYWTRDMKADGTVGVWTVANGMKTYEVEEVKVNEETRKCTEKITVTKLGGRKESSRGQTDHLRETTKPWGKVTKTEKRPLSAKIEPCPQGTGTKEKCALERTTKLSKEQCKYGAEAPWHYLNAKCLEDSANGWKVGDLASVDLGDYKSEMLGNKPVFNYKSPTGAYVTQVSITYVTDLPEVYCYTDYVADKAANRPSVYVNRASVLFASLSNQGRRKKSRTLGDAKTMVTTEMKESEAEGYKLTLKDPSMSITGVNVKAGIVNAKLDNRNISIKPGTKELKLDIAHVTNGATDIAASAVGKDGTLKFGEISDATGSSPAEATLDLTNLMDTTTGGSSKVISFYVEQQNGAGETDYISAPYDITVTVVEDQAIALQSGTVPTGEYGEELILTAMVNELVNNRTWDKEKALVATIAAGYEDYAEVKSSTWDPDTGTTEIILKPKKSGKVKLKLHKDENLDKGFSVDNNDVITAEITINKRKVTLTPKKQTHKLNDLYVEPEIIPSYTGDPDKSALVNSDILPDTISVSTTNKTTSAKEDIPTRTLSGKTRLSAVGTWTQEIDHTAYDADSTSDLHDKYEFTTATAEYIVSDADAPVEGDIVITPACTYNDDTNCWNSGDVTIKPSDAAKTNGYTLIKDTTLPNDSIETSEEGFRDEFIITEKPRTVIKDIKFNLATATKDHISAQGTVGRSIRIDDTEPAKINVTSAAAKSAASRIMEATAKAIVTAVGGDAGGIRFDSNAISLSISAEDEESGIRFIEAYEVSDTGAETKLTLTKDTSKFEINTGITGPGSTEDGTLTYRKKTYTATVSSGFSGKVRIVATNNAGLQSEKTTSKIVNETKTDAEAGMKLEAGTGAVRDGTGTYKITKAELNSGTDIKWPLKIQAPKSGIKQITYYITDASDTPLSGSQTSPHDVTSTGFGITPPPSTLAWDKAADNALDVDEHDKAVVSLQEAIEHARIKGKGNAVIQVHAKLESNAGNVKEEVFPIQILYQDIEWSTSITDKDIDKVTPEITLETTYGTPIDLSAEMTDVSNRWSATGDFTYTLTTGDEKYAKLVNEKQLNHTTSGNPTGTAKGKATVKLIPLTGDDTEVTVKVKKAGDTEYLDSDEIELKVKLKSKAIDITADPTETYDLKTGEKHPKLTWKITDHDKTTGGLVKDTDAGIEDKELDYLLKATTCATGKTCGITSLQSYVQETDRIDQTGEWKLEFQYDKSVKDATAQGVFNKKYEISFIDYKSAGKGTDKTLKVTQDAFTEDWYTITEPKDEVKDDTDAWNTGTITLQPTNKAVTKDTKERRYTTITNADLIKKGDAADATRWGWVDSFTHQKKDGTSPKTYELRFRDPTTGAFTASADARRSVRVDEDEPTTINFKTKVKDGASPLLNLMVAVVEAAAGDASGIRFANKATILTVDATDTRSGIREIKAYKVNADNTLGDEIALTYDSGESTENTAVEGTGSTLDGEKTYSKKTYTAELGSTFNSKVRILATDNAGNQSSKTTNQIVIEKSAEAEMVLEPGAAAPKSGTNYTVSNSYVNGAPEKLWPMKIQAPHSGIKKITYYITDKAGKELDGTADTPYDVTGTGKFGIEVLPNGVAWTKADDKVLDTVVHDEAVVSLKSAVNQMKGKANAIIQVHAKLESNAGNTKEETFDIHISNQQITWSKAVTDADKDPSPDAVEVEAVYGTPLDISAEMIQESTGWSATSDFTYKLGDGETAYANIAAKGTSYSELKTTGNPGGTAKGKAGITLIPLTGDDQIVTLKVKKESDDEYLESNEIELKVKLKSKAIDITADPTETYDLKTGEKHPKLTWKITDKDKTTGGLVKDTDAGIDDKEMDYLLKATTCATGKTCGITSLQGYVQETDRIDQTGEWKLEFQYDPTVKDATAQGVFNKKYAITFVDYDDTGNTDKTLKVTQDSFDDTWYTLLPDADDKVKSDTDAWNTGTITLKSTDKAVTKDKKERKYTTITNADLIKNGDATDATSWGWVDSFTHQKKDGTSPKTYELRFRDPVTGAFTAAADARRSVRVDETAPIKPFISINNSAVPAVPDDGLVQGTRFSKNGLDVTVSIVDEESGIRSLKIYTVDQTGKGTEITDASVTDDAGTVEGVKPETKAVRKKTAAFTIEEEFKGSIRIVGMNNAGQSTTYETMQIINEPEKANKLTIVKDEEDEKIPDKITRDNYDESYRYPWKIDAPISGIRKVKYTMWIDDEEGSVKTLLTNNGDITKALSVEDAEDKAVVKGTSEKTPTYALDKSVSAYGTYFSIKPYIDKMLAEQAGLGTIHIKLELESNAGNILEEEFELPIDLTLNDPAAYIITPKLVKLERNDEETEAAGSAEVELIKVNEDDKPAGLDITQYFNIYTPHEITLMNEDSYHKDTFTVSVFDESGKQLSSEKNLLAALNYPEKLKSKMTLTTPLVTDPAKDKDSGEYRGLMTYTVKYGKKDTGKQP